MATPIVMPRLGNTVESCLIVRWLKNVGDSIAVGEPIVEVETDKTMMEVESPAAGALLEIFFKADEDVPVMTNIAAIGAAGEDASAFRPGGAVSKSTTPSVVTETALEQKAATPEIIAAQSAPVAAASSSSSAASPRAKNLAANAGIKPASLNGTGPSGRVIERDVKAAIQNAPHLSPAARETVLSGQLVSPAQGTGLGGMVLKADLQKSSEPPKKAAIASGTTREIPVKGVRKVIAERMHKALASTAQLTLHVVAKATALQEFRKSVKAHGQVYGLSDITINDLIVYAVSRVLPRHPRMNAHFLGDKIIEFGDVNLGIAVDTERGLIVPVVPCAQTLSLPELSRAIKPLVEACHAGNISPDLLHGATFTITNLGSLGIEYFTPIVNAPEVAILGVDRISIKPFQTERGIELLPAITLSLTIDHQAIDAAPASRFLADLTIAIENLGLILC